MATFHATRARNLRVILRRRSIKFVLGKFSTDDKTLAADLRTFALTHPTYGIEEGGAPVTTSTSRAPRDDSQDQDAFDGMNVVELREEARERGLSMGGNRSDLLARLRGDEEQEV